MNATKKRILEAGRCLFNQHGLSQVSQRRIAGYLEISPGNLTYHFKKSEDIVEALYFELVAAMDRVMEEVKSKKFELKTLFQQMNAMVDLSFEYRFFFLDFVQIMRNHEKLKRNFAQVSAMRKEQFMEAVRHLTDSQLMRREELPQEYDFLYERFQLMADFWISSAIIREEALQKQILENYKNILSQALYPYLTAKGKRIFLEIRAKATKL